jgi:hypothetical protein
MFKKRVSSLYSFFLVELGKESPQINNISIVREFPDVFLKELLGLPLERKVEVSINVLPGMTPIT